MPAAKRSEFAALTVLVAGAVWLLAPSVAWFDSGELAASAVELGVPHPTGFALFDLAGHTMARLPLGPAALRVHLLGALAAILACWLWLRALQPATQALGSRPQRWLAAVAWGALCLLPLLVQSTLLHVRAAEVYPLAWLVTAASIAVIVRLPAPKRVIALGLLSGLGLGVHVEAALLPGLACLAGGLEPVVRGRRPLLLPLLSATLLGLFAACACLYLPLAAARNPVFSWGDVRTPTALFDHLSGASIRHAFAGETGPGHYRAGLEALGRFVWRDGRAFIAPALLGVAACWRSARRALVWTLLAMIIDAAYSAFINPMGLRDDQTGLIVLLGLGALAAAGVLAVLQSVGVQAHLRLAGPLLSVAALAWTASVASTTVDVRPQADLVAGARLADRLWRGAAPGALLLTSSDTRGSACAWTQAGEGQRPDCLCMPLVFARSPEQLRRLGARTDRPALLAGASLLDVPWTPQRAADVLAGWLRPSLQTSEIAWEAGLGAEDAQVEPHLEPGFAWSHVRPDRVPTAAREAGARAQWSGVQAFCAQGLPDVAGGCSATPQLSEALGLDVGLSAALLLRRDAHLAAELLSHAASLAPDNPKILNNLAVVDLEQGKPREALALVDQVLARNPGYVLGYRTAARAALRSGQPDRAVLEAARYLEARHASPESRTWLRGLQAEASPELAVRFKDLLPP